MKMIKIEATIACHPASDHDTARGVAGFAASELQRLVDYFAKDGHVLKFEATLTNSDEPAPADRTEGDEPA